MKFDLKMETFLGLVAVMLPVTSAVLGLGPVIQETSPEETGFMVNNPYAIVETADERRRELEGYARERRANGDELMTDSLLRNACPFPKSLRGEWKEDLGEGVVLKEVGQHSLILQQNGKKIVAMCYGQDPTGKVFLISYAKGGKYYSTCLQVKTTFPSKRQYFNKMRSPFGNFFTETAELPTGKLCSP